MITGRGSSQPRSSSLGCHQGFWLMSGHSSTEPSNRAWPSLPPGAAGQLAGVSRSRRIMTCEVLMDHTLATGKLLTTRQPSAA